MPRAPAAIKRQQGAANHRDTRHENGLVGPGKRVLKQKSNGHLNGQPKSSDTSPSTPPQLANTLPATNGHVRQPPTDNSNDPKLPVNGLRRSSFSAYSEETSSSESYNNMPSIAVHSENHRRIDVNAAKNPAVHRDVGPLSLAFTVLRSCPLFDTIAILIVLLQIPPTFLSIIHILFATLTFVPPSTSTTSGISFSDIFEGTMGTPSLATIVFVDIFVLLVWLFLWAPIQDIVLDLAQTVIALTLGGGTSGKEAGMNNVLVCFSIVGFSHLVRSTNVKQSGLRAILASSTNSLFGSSDPDDPLEPTSQSIHKKGAHGWIRSILAIHILTQGAVRYIRDWYVRREKQNTSVSLLDPEAGKVQTDANSEAPPQPLENESSNLPTTSITSKKKKKQSAQVRIRQPLWAALASTKIVMVKEYETSHTAAESAGTNATDINNLGNAPFNTEADRIWITYVGSDEVFFATSYFPTHTAQETCEEKDAESPDIDQSKPFFVRVNKTLWRPTKIHTATDPNQPEGQETRWSGEIFGLAPMSSYECDFVSTTDGSVIFSTRVRTVQPAIDVAAPGLSAGPVVSGRPGSPTTTLKTSIASSEVKLAEERNRQKRERKDQRAKLSSIRKEIEKLGSAVASSGGNDDRQRQKVQQHHLHMKQADEAITMLDYEIEALSGYPTDAELDELKAAKFQYQSQKDIHKKARKEYTAIKDQAREEVQILTNDVANLESKRERIQFRNAKLTSELERITDANARGLNEAQRKITEQQAKEVERQNMEGLYHRRLIGITTELTENHMQLDNLRALVAQLEAMEQSEVQYAQSPDASAANLVYSEIPEGSTASNYPWNPPPNVGLYAPSYPMMASGSNQGARARGRSSSMLSNVSGFTQSSGDGDLHQLHVSGQNSFSKFVSPNMYNRERQGSSESASVSGSGSRSGNGSIGDPKSPTVDNSSAKKYVVNGSVGGDKAIADEK